MKKKFLLIILLSFFLNTGLCNAEIKTFDRTESNNYGVNKKWTINSSNLPNVLKTPYVDADDKIYDFEDILTSNEENKLKDLIDEFEEETGFEFIILSDDVINYNELINETYATDFYDYNDFGLDDEYYSGVIFFRNNNENKYYGIWCFGDAQFYFPNEDRLNDVLDSIYGDMIRGNYYEAITYTLEELTYYHSIGIPNSMKYYELDEYGMLVKTFNPHFIIVSLISIVITAIYISILIGKNKMVSKASTAYDYLDKSSIVYTRKDDQFLHSRTTSYSISTSSGGGSGGVSSRGSSGGGHSGGGRRG